MDSVFDVAALYDLNPDLPDDLPFYRSRIGDRAPRLLELGCGTGRVFVSLARICRLAVGIDSSGAMLEACAARATRHPPSPGQIEIVEGDIVALDLGRRFDLIIAPFRVLQALESDEQLDGLFESIRSHLAPGGTCVLTAFRPYWPAHELRQRWITGTETFQWETCSRGYRVTCHDRRRRMDRERLVLFPDLIYRVYEEQRLVQRVVRPIVMRCFYPDQLPRVVEEHGFRVLGRWGGYDGEPYGHGPELVLELAEPAG